MPVRVGTMMKSVDVIANEMEGLRLVEGSTTHVMDLPDDIFYLVFYHLSPSDLAKVCRVCHRFNALASSDVVWVGLLNRTFVVDPCGRLNPEHREISAKVKLRVAQNWTSNRCTRYALANHHVKLLPWLQLCGSQLWVSQEHQIKCYGTGRNGSWTERPSNSLQIHPDAPDTSRRNRRSRRGFRRNPNPDITHFISKDNYLVAGNSKGEVCAWEKDSREQISMYTQYHRGEVHCVDILNDFILSGSRDGNILVSPLFCKDTERGDFSSTTCISIGERVWSLAASPCRSQYVTGSAGCLPNTSPLVLWDFATGQEVLSLEMGHQVGAGVLGIHFETPDCLLTCGYDTYLKLWDLRASPPCVRRWEDPDDQSLYSLDSDLGNAMVTGGARYGMVRLWDKRAVAPVQSYYNGPSHHSSPVYSVAIDFSHIFVALDRSIDVIDFK